MKPRPLPTLLPASPLSCCPLPLPPYPPPPLSAPQLNLFEGTCYLTPLLGAWLADSAWGRYKTILVFSFIYLFVSRKRFIVFVFIISAAFLCCGLVGKAGSFLHPSLVSACLKACVPPRAARRGAPSLPRSRHPPTVRGAPPRRAGHGAAHNQRLGAGPHAAAGRVCDAAAGGRRAGPGSLCRGQRGMPCSASSAPAPSLEPSAPPCYTATLPTGRA